MVIILYSFHKERQRQRDQDPANYLIAFLVQLKTIFIYMLSLYLNLQSSTMGVCGWVGGCVVSRFYYELIALFLHTQLLIFETASWGRLQVTQSNENSLVLSPRKRGDSRIFLKGTETFMPEYCKKAKTRPNWIN